MKASDIQVGAKLVRVRFSEDETLPMYLNERFLTVVDAGQGESAAPCVRLRPYVRLRPEGAAEHVAFPHSEVVTEFEVADSPEHEERRRRALSDAAWKMQQEISDRWELLQRVRATIQLVGQT
jgi:hypothetical protein